MSLEYYIILISIFASGGLMFNGYILLILLCSAMSGNTVLMFFMAFADGIFCLLILIGNASLYGTGVPVYTPETLYNTQTGCKLQGSLWTVLPLCMLWSICGITIDRYIAITKPFIYVRTVNVKRAILMLSSVWVLCFLLALPPYFGICQHQFSVSRFGCIMICSTFENDINLIAIKVTFVVLYTTIALLPIIIILICNIHILMIARFHHHNIVSAICEIAVHTHESQHNCNYFVKYKGPEACYVIFQLIGSLLILMVPYFVIGALDLMSGTDFAINWSSAATLMLSLSPLVNAYLYGVKSKVLQKNLKRMLEASLEIDRRLSLRSQSSLRIAEGMYSLIAASTLSSNGAYKKPQIQRRYSAPLNLSYESTQQNSLMYYLRRQSLSILDKSQLKSIYQTQRNIINCLSRRPSFVEESKINNANIVSLSPIQETHGGMNDCPTNAIVN